MTNEENENGRGEKPQPVLDDAEPTLGDEFGPTDRTTNLEVADNNRNDNEDGRRERDANRGESGRGAASGRRM